MLYHSSVSAVTYLLHFSSHGTDMEPAWQRHRIDKPGKYASI